MLQHRDSSTKRGRPNDIGNFSGTTIENSVFASLNKVSNNKEFMRPNYLFKLKPGREIVVKVPLSPRPSNLFLFICVAVVAHFFKRKKNKNVVALTTRWHESSTYVPLVQTLRDSPIHNSLLLRGLWQI